MKLAEAGPFRHSVRALSVLVFLAGASALIYEQIWIRRCTIMFGSTAPGVAITLAAYFLGLALGTRWAGKASCTSALRAFATCQAAGAVGAALCIPAEALLSGVIPGLYRLFGGTGAALHAAKLAAAFAAMLPVTFALGASLPFLVRVAPDERVANRWYGWNTAGAAMGGAATGFMLPVVLGVTGTYALGIAVTALVAVLAFRRAGSAGEPSQPAPAALPAGRPARAAAAFLCGFAGLSLEVLWTRLYAQVLPNSTISFTIILLLFLGAFSIAPFLTNRLLVPRLPRGLWIAAGVAACLVWAAPAVFYATTSGLRYVPSRHGLVPFALDQLGVGLVSFVPALIAVGTMLPSLWSLSWEPRVFSRLLCWNLLGGAAGALVVGLFALELLGLLGANAVCGAVLAFVPVLALVQGRRRLAWGGAFALAAALAIIVVRFPLYSLSADRAETILASRESREGMVTVTRKGEHFRIRLDNHYVLGGTESQENEERQAHLPLLLHPRPERVAFLGTGTGITAGGACLHPVRAITTIELIPAVSELAAEYFRPHCHGLYDDPRVRAVTGDARQILLCEENRYDVIVSDLFVPWHVGAGNLYAEDFFRIVRKRLRPRGLFCLWLPLYQVSQREFHRIVATVAAVFEDVTLWHGDFYVDRPIVAIIGKIGVGPFSLGALPIRVQRLREAGVRDGLVANSEGVAMLWMGTARHVELPASRNSDNWPCVEYGAAYDQARGRSAFTETAWVDFCRETARTAVPDAEKVLGTLTTSQRQALGCGPVLLEFVLATVEGNRKRAHELGVELHRNLPGAIYAHHAGSTLASPDALRAEIERLRREMTEKIRVLEADRRHQEPGKTGKGSAQAP